MKVGEGKAAQVSQAIFRDSKGFSHVEILITIALAVVLATIALPLLMEFQSRAYNTESAKVRDNLASLALSAALDMSEFQSHIVENSMPLGATSEHFTGDYKGLTLQAFVPELWDSTETFWHFAVNGRNYSVSAAHCKSNTSGENYHIGNNTGKFSINDTLYQPSYCS